MNSYRVVFVDHAFDSDSVEAVLMGRVLDVMKGKDYALKERLIETLKSLIAESVVRQVEIAALGTTVRTYNALVGRGIKTVGDLLDQIAEDGGDVGFRNNTRHFGNRSMKELRGVLEQLPEAALRGRNLDYFCYGPYCPNPQAAP